MRKVKLIYNPFSGDKSFKFNLDPVIHCLQKSDLEVHIFRSIKENDIDLHLSKIDKDYYYAIIVSGGDGSINIVLNAMMKYKINARLGIIPSGTANDFASFLKIPFEPDKAAEVITNEIIKEVDIGLANNQYFINVCGAGLLTNISNQVDVDFKNIMGKLAYYLKGLEQIPNFVPIPIRITNSQTIIEENVYLFFVLNSAGTGGFNKLSKYASIDDGVFDFIAIKAKPMVEMAVLFLKILSGEYLDDSNIIYFQDNYIQVECLDEENNKIMHETDVDGEIGPELPVTITVIPKALEIFVPCQY